jgi:hypothetical protein
MMRNPLALCSPARLRIRYALAGLPRERIFLLTFLSQGWRSRIRLSSSHFTSASSSFVCSTVPNSPVGFPKLAKPSTRSPGFSSDSGAEGWTSGGLSARSASAGAPTCDRGGCGALRSFGVSLLIRLIFDFPGGFCFVCPSSLYVKHALGKDGSADPNCTVLTINLVDLTDCRRKQCGSFGFRRRS